MATEVEGLKEEVAKIKVSKHSLMLYIYPKVIQG